MSNNTARRLLSFLIVALMVLSGVVVLAGATARAAPVSVAQADRSSQGPSPETTAGAPTSTDKIGQPPSLALWKIDSALQSVALSGDKGWSYVEIRSVAGAELGRLLTSYGARVSSDLALEGRPIGPITFRNVATDNLPVIQRVWIPNAALSSISALPSTISVSLPLVPKLDSSQQGPTTPLGEDRIDRTAIAHALQEQGIELTNFPSYLEHGSLAARQDYGVTGSGASIAIVDTPVDFGQANLVGQWAVNQNASSPYFGWPIVGDTGSLSDNLALWTTSSDLDRFPYPLLSSRGTFNSNFLSDTHYEAAVNATGYLHYANGVGGYAARADPAGVSGVVNNSLLTRDYYVGDSSDPNRIVSASGVYRLGVLKDDHLTAVYGQRVGLLLVDRTTPGVYDTVYADLNFDNRFTDENPATRASPLLYRDLDADGLPDISGGLVYFIASSTAVSNEVVIASATGKEKYALLANRNLAADVYDFFSMDLPTLSMNGAYWPSAGEDIFEVLNPSTAGNEKDTRQLLSSGNNLLSGAPVDTTTLLQSYNLSKVYGVFGNGGQLSEGVDYEINMDTGEIHWLHNFGIGDFLYIVYEFQTWRVDFATGNVTFLAPPRAGSVVRASYQTGVPLPYADVLARRHGYDLFVPANGDLVGTYGAYLIGGNCCHGTSTATTAAGKPAGMTGTLFDTWGQAPGAKVISVAMFKPGATIDDSWAFAVEGPDGTPGTGDEANIASNSWGWTDQPASGWEYYSRLKYYLNTVYAPGTVFVQSTGNEGPGYATEASPTASSSIQAGAATSTDVFWLFQALGAGLGYGGGPQYSWPLGLNGSLGPGPYGDVVSFSSRGPNALGQPGPDILGIGEAGIAGIPVNEVFSGQDAFDIFFAGTSQAAPNIAGIVALIMEAYASAHGGQMPTTAVIQSILKTTADDVHQETIAQGAGFADALRAVKVAKEIEGVTSDVHEWIPGGFAGKHRDMFVNLLAPGASDKTKITLTNHGTSPVTVSLSTGVFERSGTFSFNWIYPNTCAGGLRTGRPDFWVFNKTGVWNSHDPDHPGDALAKAADPGLPALWDGADLMKVYAYTDPKVATQRGALGLYDWVDVNGNGIWDRFTEESYIAPVVFGGDFAGGQLNARTVYSPGVRIHSGLGISASALAGTCSGGPLPETLYVEFYQRVPWSVLSLDRSSVTIPAAGTATVNVTATVPAGTAPGSYAGGVYYNDGSNTSTIQVLINVPVTRLPGNLGGGLAKGGLYEDNAFTAGFVDPTMGDGRWFFFDTNAMSAPNRKLLYNLNWENPSSDAEILSFGLVADSNFATDSIFGPGTFALKAHTKRAVGITDTVEPQWEFLGSDVSSLFIVKLQALTTTVPHETFNANVGVLTVNTNDVRISSNHRTGSVPVTVSANVPLRSGVKLDPSLQTVFKDATTTFADQAVSPYPYTTGPYINYLFNAPNTVKTQVVSGTKSASWSLFFHSGARDVDMGIFFDANCDGTYTVADDVIGYIQGSTLNNPETATVSAPTPGCYWVHAAGFDVDPGSLFDLTFVANVPATQGMSIAVTQALSTVTKDLRVDSYAYGGQPFLIYLFDSANRYKTEVAAGTIIATWSMLFHPPASDVDFGIFYDANCDGVYTVADSAVGTVAATSNNPETATKSFPAPGCYWVHAAGFAVAGSALFDLTLAVTVLGASAFSPVGLPESAIAADTEVQFDIDWSFDAAKQPGVTTDFLFVSPGNSPFALTQTLQVTFSFDLTPPSFSSPLPSPGATVASTSPGVFVQIDDTQRGSIAPKGEIDERTIRIWLDGQDVTALSQISVPFQNPSGTANDGYNIGTVLFVPTAPLSEGGHTVLVQAGDFAGNTATTSWSFTVDTSGPVLDILAPTPGFATSSSSVTVQGRTERSATVTVASSSVNVDDTGAFSAVVALADGANVIDVTAVDANGNTARTSITVIRDSAAPSISVLRSSAGVLTNKDLTVISGVVSEAASLTVAGIPATVRADGSFEVPVSLVEGANTINLVAVDAAGNQGSGSLTVTRDSTPPAVTIDALPTEVSSATVTVSGTVESTITFVTVNGQPVTVTNGRYSASVALSFGSNVIFVEATDAAGNRATASTAVSYVPQGVTTASVGLVLLPVLTVIALLAGLAIGQARRGRGGGGGGEPKLEEMSKVSAAEEEELPPPGGEL